MLRLSQRESRPRVAEGQRKAPLAVCGERTVSLGVSKLANSASPQTAMTSKCVIIDISGQTSSANRFRGTRHCSTRPRNRESHNLNTRKPCGVTLYSWQPYALDLYSRQGYGLGPLVGSSLRIWETQDFWETRRQHFAIFPARFCLKSHFVV